MASGAGLGEEGSSCFGELSTVSVNEGSVSLKTNFAGRCTVRQALGDRTRSGPGLLAHSFS